MKETKRNEHLLWGSRWITHGSFSIIDMAMQRVWTLIASPNMVWWNSCQILSGVLAAVSSIIAGLIADRRNKKRVLQIIDILLTAICLAIAIMADQIISAGAYMLIVLGVAVVTAFRNVVFITLIKDLTPKDRIGKWNCISSIGCQLVALGGAIIASIILKGTGLGIFRILFVLSAILFLLSVYMDSKMELPQTDPQLKQEEKNNCIEDLWQGLLYLAREWRILLLIAYYLVIHFLEYGYSLVLSMGLAQDTALSQGSEYARSVYANLGIYQIVAGIIAVLVSLAILQKDKELAQGIMMLTSGAAIVIIRILMQAENANLLMVAIILQSTAMACYKLIYIIHLQERVDKKYIGRVIGISFCLTSLFELLGRKVFIDVAQAQNPMTYALIGMGMIGMAAACLVIRIALGKSQQ